MCFHTQKAWYIRICLKRWAIDNDLLLVVGGFCGLVSRSPSVSGLWRCSDAWVNIPPRGSRKRVTPLPHVCFGSLFPQQWFPSYSSKTLIHLHWKKWLKQDEILIKYSFTVTPTKPCGLAWNFTPSLPESSLRSVKMHDAVRDCLAWAQTWVSGKYWNAYFCCKLMKN